MEFLEPICKTNLVSQAALASRLGVSHQRVEYLLATRKIRPYILVDGKRALFSEDQLASIYALYRAKKLRG